MKRLNFLFVPLMAMFIFTSCTEDPLNVQDSAVVLKGAKLDPTVDTWPDDVNCVTTYSVIAGQSTVSGTVEVGEYNGDIFLKYNAAEGFLFTETHVYLGDVKLILDKKGGPKIGHFPFANENPDGDAEVIYQIPKDLIEVNSNGDKYESGDCFEIAAHCVVVCAENEMPIYEYDAEGNPLGFACEETGWAGKTSSEEVFVIKSLMHSPEGPTISYPIDWSNVGNEVVFDLQSSVGQVITIWGHSSAGNIEVGKLTVELNDDIAKLTITPDFSTVFWSYLFLGSMEELNLIGKYNFWAFPYKIMEESSEHVFEIPVSLDSDGGMTFESLGSSRWGFFVEYCPC